MFLGFLMFISNYCCGSNGFKWDFVGKIQTYEHECHGTHGVVFDEEIKYSHIQIE